ncbi:MAG TPA: type II toxin-antitoxin system VapB family antitoxin [Candidatus Angelobacter sp.]|jgi:metal-responsive CopG/Arc/MetJ family transcriptional regulator|nr:type II toxin-antitoxin system VapB family antitoxin [Candidatus Angelobacter sp.]
MAVTTTSMKINVRLVDEAATILGTKSRAETVRTALREIVALRHFKKLMKKHAGKLEFAGHDK